MVSELNCGGRFVISAAIGVYIAFFDILFTMIVARVETL